jgi:hypothetical protein
MQALQTNSPDRTAIPEFADVFNNLATLYANREDHKKAVALIHVLCN